MEEEHMNTLQSIFAGIDDARVERTRLHTLLDIMIIAILGVLCGADGWVEIEAFGNTKEAWLNTFLELPSAHPVTRYRCRVSLPASIPSSLRSVCLSWVRGVTEKLTGVIAIDGKTLRRSHDAANGKKARPLVSAWADAKRMVLAQVAVDEKSNAHYRDPSVSKPLGCAGMPRDD